MKITEQTNKYYKKDSHVKPRHVNTPNNHTGSVVSDLDSGLYYNIDGKTYIVQ